MLLVSAAVKRDLSQIGQKVLAASVGGVATTAILVMVVLAVLLQWVLVGPLVRLTQHVVEVGADGTLNRRVSLQRRDEIGILGREFDRMLARLAEARNRLLDHSYQARIAHMASGVLHNVRNQLMPVTTRVERLHERLSERSTERLDAAIAEFTSERTMAERKKKIAVYIALSMQDMRDRQKGIAAGLRAISEDLLRIEDVLRDLDRFSRVSTKIEPVSLASCIHETIKAVPSIPDVTVAIRLDPEVERQPPVVGESFILKHVLQNLFVNATEAIVSAGKAAGTIEVTASSRTIDGEDFIDLAIGDDGVGIPAEHLVDRIRQIEPCFPPSARGLPAFQSDFQPDSSESFSPLAEIFKRGFSTKKDHRRGAGLHWCANSISAMSGRIFAESVGPNHGATLHVLLKVASAAKSVA